MHLSALPLKDGFDQQEGEPRTVPWSEGILMTAIPGQIECWRRVFAGMLSLRCSRRPRNAWCNKDWSIGKAITPSHHLADRHQRPAARIGRTGCCQADIG